MSTMAYGKRRFLDDSEESNSQLYKKFRYNSAEQFNQQVNLERLVGLFPHFDSQLLVKALEVSGNDVDLAIKRLQEHQDTYANRNSESTAEETANVDNGEMPAGVEQVQNNLPTEGSEWIKLLVREINTAASEEDARSRAEKILGKLEESISSRSAEATQKEIVMQKEQIEMLLRDNMILKRAVGIQHERQKEHEKNQVAQQMIAQYQEHIRKLEMRNYTLSMHLRQAQQNNTFPSHFNPDVF